MSKHTPGPWSVHQLTGSAFGDVGIRAEGKVVAGYVALMNTRWPHAGQQEEQRANAKLIAAAPELLTALDELLAAELTQMPAYEAGKAAQDAWADRRAAARNNARVAITKATGEA